MELEMNYEVSEWDLPEALFVREVTERGLNYTASVSYETSERSFGDPEGFGRVLVQKSEGREYALFRFGEAVVYACIGRSQLELRVAGDQEVAREAIARIRKVCPEVEAEDRKVTYRFWFQSGVRSRNRQRSIDVPDWGEIAANYNAQTAESLEAMLETEAATTGGALNLWFGPPGTGKTFAVRALSWAWRDWCDFEYVLDPERFFADADYMLSVLLYEPDDDERWRILILEDGGDMLRLDAKDGTSHGLSRLLNVADGLIGQGLQIQFLITTNESVAALHPAVARPGRCGFEVEFKPLTYIEASRWMSRKRMPLPERSSFTLADLYAICDGSVAKSRASERTLGFIA